jgi:hypothetical protein
MPHQLDFISKSDILQAISKIDAEGVPNNHLWSEYWIYFNSNYYQYKYIVEVASTFTDTPITTYDFQSNESNRHKIASIGFHIVFRTPTVPFGERNYWVAGSYYGPFPGNQIDMIADFTKEGYWQTDHDPLTKEGKKIYSYLTQIKINDRLCLRYLNRRGGTVELVQMGTVSGLKNISDGKVEVKWDYNSPEKTIKKPSGQGAGNWWTTIFQLKDQRYIEEVFEEKELQRRACRITWNTNGWVMPSGPTGKSKSTDAHEGNYGYGHEEWLFDTGKIIDGYHYSFLEPIRKNQDAYTNQNFNIWLYSINGQTKDRYWIGEINNVNVIEREESDKIYEIYLQKGWIKEMEDQIKFSGGTDAGFSDWKGINLFNVKFKISDIKIQEDYVLIPKENPINILSRYVFANFKEEFILEKEELSDNFKFVHTETTDAEDSSDVKTKKVIRQPKAIEIVYLHDGISKSLTKSLRSEFGEKNVMREHWAGYGANRIDIIVNKKDKLSFYEIKTYASIKNCIREAIGQLMEYCFYPSTQKAVELIIVSQTPADTNTKKYMAQLRSCLNIPLYYQSYDLEKEFLSDKS